MHKLTIISLTIASIIGLGVVWLFLIEPTDYPTANSGGDTGQTARTGRAYGPNPKSPSVQEIPKATPDDTLTDGGQPKAGSQPYSAEDEPLYDEVFITEFNRLAASSEWRLLERYLTESIRDAPDLKEFLPVLLGCLSSVEDRIGYNPVGRGVQLGMYGRSDLKEHAELLADAFMETDSPVLQVSLATAVARANYDNPNNSHLKRYVEGLLVNRKETTAALPASEKFTYIWYLLSGHLRYSSSALESIEFMESLKVSGLSDSHVRWFWDGCAMSFRAKRYFEGEGEAIVRYLIAHTDESLKAKKGSKKEVARLTKIWVTFREQQAYDAAVKHADDATDEMIQDAYDQILAKWLAYEE